MIFHVEFWTPFEQPLSSLSIKGFNWFWRVWHCYSDLEKSKTFCNEHRKIDSLFNLCFCMANSSFTFALKSFSIVSQPEMGLAIVMVRQFDLGLMRFISEAIYSFDSWTTKNHIVIFVFRFVQYKTVRRTPVKCSMPNIVYIWFGNRNICTLTKWFSLDDLFVQQLYYITYWMGEAFDECVWKRPINMIKSHVIF